MEGADEAIKGIKRFLGTNPGFEKQGSRTLYYVREDSLPLIMNIPYAPNYIVEHEIETKKETIYKLELGGNPNGTDTIPISESSEIKV